MDGGVRFLNHNATVFLVDKSIDLMHDVTLFINQLVCGGFNNQPLLSWWLNRTIGCDHQLIISN
jgi:hypothetical protein